MSVIVEIAFTGICAFIQPDVVLCPNAVKHDHVLWVAVDQGEPPTETKERKELITTRYLLNSEEMWLGGTTQRSENDAAQGGEVEPPKPNSTSLHWVVPFKTATGVSSLALKPEYLDPSKHANSTSIGLWFHIPSNAQPPTTSYVRNCIWDFKKSASDPAAPTASQSLAQEVSIKTAVPDTNTIALVSRDMATGDFITRQFPVTGGRIRLLIGNTLPSQIEPDGGHQEVEDTHFLIYYDMLANPPTDKPRPIRRCGDLEVRNGRRMSGLNCPPVILYELGKR